MCVYTVRQSSLNISGQLSLPSWKSKQEPGPLFDISFENSSNQIGLLFVFYQTDDGVISYLISFFHTLLALITPAEL
jgi:hypothetical protein